MKKSKPLSRRAFLRGARNVAISLPFLEIMARNSSDLFAQSSQTNFLLIHQPWGFGPGWEPNVNGDGTLNLAGLTMDELSPYKDKLLFMKGFIADTPQPEHASLFAPVFSGRIGSFAGDDYTFDGPSIDQVIANTIGNNTKFRSLELEADMIPDYVAQSFSWKAAGQKLQRYKDPQVALNTIFANVQSGNGNPPSPAALAEVDRGKSILDGVLEDLERLKKKIGAKDKERVDMHLTSVREIEKRITPPASSPGCNVPTLTPLSSQLNLDTYTKRIKSHYEIAATAFACGLTRVASIQLGYRDFEDVGFGSHHNLGHDHLDPNKTASHIARQNSEKYYVSRIKEALDKLNAYNILNNTVVLVLSSMANGNHEVGPHKVLIAGNANGYFKTNKYVQFAAGTQMNRLHLSVLRAFGNMDTTFGLPERCQGGPLAEIKA